MPFNGSGVFQRVYNWATDKTNNVLITASRMDTEDDGFATGLSTCLTKDGQQVATANQPMGGFKHTNVGLGTVRTSGSMQYADVQSVQDGTYHYAVAGGSGDGLTLALSPAIPGYTAGQVFWARLTATNATTAPTLAVSGLAAKTIKRLGGNALVAGDLISGATAGFAYNANTDAFELISPLGASTGSGATVRATSPTLVTPILGAASATSVNFGDEALSKYDEGTWTPAYTLGSGSVTYTTQAGKYIRIGNLVFFSGVITVNAATTPSGGLTLTGLPFTIFNANGNRFCISLHPGGWASSLTTPLTSFGDINTTTAGIYKYAATGGSGANPGGDVANSCTLYFSGTYITAV